jgi:hypothetical protein
MMVSDLDLSEDQQEFVEAAYEEGYEPFVYSGRCMFGEQCPAISIIAAGEFKCPVPYAQDDLGKGYVIYVRK